MKIEKIVILGGGVTGCAVAASLAHALLKAGVEICVIELDSDQNNLPHDDVETLSPYTQIFHETLGLDEAKTLAYTQGAFNLGTSFNGWKNPAAKFLQTYDGYGVDFEGVGFQNFYTRFKENQLGDYDQYSLSAVAAIQGKFSHPVNDNKSVLSTLMYGLNLASKPYAELLKQYSVSLGVVTKSGRFISAKINEEGEIQEISLAQEVIVGNFFIDCSGPDALLIGGALGIKNNDWSEYFFCNRRVSFTATHLADLPAASSITAYENYWIKSVPLQQHSTNILMYNDKYLDENAVRAITGNENTVIRSLTHGHKQKLWHKNVIAFGDAAASFEPLAFSGMDLLYRNIQAFIKLLPVDTCCVLNADEYNRITTETYERLRDYHICHYALAQSISGFWCACSALLLPPLLEQRINLFRHRGKVVFHDGEIIPTAMWVSLLLGLGVLPENYDPAIDAMDAGDLQEKIRRMQIIIARTVEKMPRHSDYLKRYLAESH